MDIRKVKIFDIGSCRPLSLDNDKSAEARIESDLNILLPFDVQKSTNSSDEVYDTAYISEPSNSMAIASNNEDLHIYNFKTDQCIIAKGHTQSILCVASPNWSDSFLASGSKDNSILFWSIRDLKEPMETDDANISAQENVVQKIGTATGHTHSVSSIVFSHSKNSAFLVSVSHDTIMKLWPLTELIVKQEKEEGQPLKLSSSATLVAHSKDINSVDLSANDKLCVTASMDKTAKLWHIDTRKMDFVSAGTLAGHKRGVWSAQFSKNLQMVVTGSGDCTIKLFNLLDKSCTRTLEGHQFAVLSVLLIDKSSKLVSADGGGIIKVWDVKKGVCERTEEGHTDKIWSLRELPPKRSKEYEGERARFVSGSADGQLSVWEDVSEEVKRQKQREQTKQVADMQSLANLVQQDRLFEALVLTLDLEQPFQCLKILDKLAGSKERQTQLVHFVRRMDQTQLSALLTYASQWNTNTRTFATAQLVLNSVLRSIHPDQLLKLPNIESIVTGFLPYSIRHNDRLSNLRKNSSLLNYTFSCMRLC